ncbi:hypothetical protein [Pseudoxanthomonas sp.]|uniref:hypothetical protein n=1 Tax=Pseudoxanthomonas sp. TaxID=1871049 RepID=UPI002586E700|nr:hypothetical protein [Pseudoxanthomonas sp.]
MRLAFAAAAAAVRAAACRRDGAVNAAEKKSARVLTVKKTVIRFRPADAACRSE